MRHWWPLVSLFGAFLLFWPAFLFGSIHPSLGSLKATGTSGTTGALIQHHILASWFRHSVREASRQSANPHIAPHPVRRNVVVINCVSYHTEVLVGLADLVKSTGHQLSVYANLSATPDGRNVGAGLLLLKQRHGDFPIHSCHSLPDIQHQAPQATDVTIYASAAEDTFSQRFAVSSSLVRLKPNVVAAVIHNTGRADIIQSIMSCHPQVFMLGLAKRNYQRLFRTTEALAQRMGRPQPHTGWLVPFLPMAPASACLDPAAPCHAHFTVQGNIEPHRRDYPGLFQGLALFEQELRAAGVRVKLVGAVSQKTAAQLVPPQLRSIVEVHANYEYSRFYQELQASIALVPALGSIQYLDGTRITSSLISSLITGVPLLTDATFAEAYSFIPPSAFYVQHPGEALPRAMLRVAGMSAAEHAHVRASLQEAVAALQRHNSDMLMQVLHLA